MVDVQPVVETDVKLDEAEEKVRHMRQDRLLIGLVECAQPRPLQGKPRGGCLCSFEV